MQQITEGLKESAQNYKKRNKSQEHGAGVEMDENFINSSQGSLEVLIEDLSDVEHRVEEFAEDPADQSSKWEKPKLTEKQRPTEPTQDGDCHFKTVSKKQVSQTFK